MEKVNTESDALILCREYQLQIEFRKEYYGVPEYVSCHLNAWTKVIGKNFIEAVNRMVEIYHTTPCNYEKLE
jgi:hypothetical protein